MEARQGKPPDTAELFDPVVDFGVHVVVQRLGEGCLQDQAQKERRAEEAHVEVGPLSLFQAREVVQDAKDAGPGA